LEEEENITSNYNPSRPLPLSLMEGGIGASSVLAVDYTDRISTIYGKKLGILTDTSNTPIQEVSVIVTTGTLDLVTDDTTDYVAHLSDTATMT
jgi:hypothetical protein